MGIYEVYLDVYFIENVLLDAQALILVLLLLGEKIVPWRIAAGAVAGGAGAVLILLSGVGYGITYVFCVLVLDFAMLYVAIPGLVGRKMYFQKPALGIVYFHGMVFAYGKLAECAVRLGAGESARVIVPILVAAVVLFIVISRRLAEQKRIYDVVIVQNGENITCRALFDTGNLLTEPVSGKPVSVLEETDTLKGWLAESPQKYKAIPYRSIGSAHGLLEGMSVDELIIQKDNARMVRKDVVIALYKGSLSKDGAFQMILNHSLL